MHACKKKLARRIGLSQRTAPLHTTKGATLVGEDPARSEITGSADNDDCDHAKRRRCVARQLKNSTHKFPSHTHGWFRPTHWLIAYAEAKCNTASVHNRTIAHKVALGGKLKARKYSYIMRLDG